MIPAHPGLRDGPVYLDHNATTPVDPRVVDATLPHPRHHFGNPSSGHSYGEQPRRALGQARTQVAALIGARSDEIVFTGSGCEADNLALRGAVLTVKAGRPHVITQVTEHPAILETCRALERLHGTEVTYLPIDGDGLVGPTALAAPLTERTVLVGDRAGGAQFTACTALGCGQERHDRQRSPRWQSSASRLSRPCGRGQHRT